MDIDKKNSLSIKVKCVMINCVQIQLRSATSQCVLHEKTTAGLPSGRGA